MKYLVLCATLNLLFFANTVWSAVYIAPIYSDTEHSLTIYTLKHPLKVSCNVSSTEGDVAVEWKKDGVAIKSVKSVVGRVSENRKDGVSTLVIEHSTEDDAGNYTCVAVVKQTEITNATVRVTCAVKVKTQQNINVVEGEKLRIVCNVVGNPSPTISWLVLDNATYTASEGRIQLLEEPEKHIPNAILQIDAIEMTDRGVYTCIARSNLTNEENSDTCMVRVKDKYAPLWPFLGICAEVFVLCAIILIYEKKRNKTELEESDTDQSPDQKNTPDHGKESNLRHRQ